jgi:uncharacterized protein YjiS (DUF1127 family)
MVAIARHIPIYFHLTCTLARLAATLHQWSERIRQRERLARLGERELHDMGLSRSAIYAELNKPFWRD